MPRLPKSYNRRSLIDEVAQTITRYEMLSPGDALLVGVSGGVDSMALLHIMVNLMPRLGITVGIAHLNHGIRGSEAVGDARFVAQVAKGYQLPFHLAHAGPARHLIQT